MSYRLELDNGEKFDFSTTDEIMRWMWDNKSEFGVNALTYGIDEGIAKLGSVEIYTGGENQDWIVGHITRRA